MMQPVGSPRKTSGGRQTGLRHRTVCGFAHVVRVNFVSQELLALVALG
jgi:hypothetical protein